MDEPRLLILETSGRAGFVAVARRTAVVGCRRLDEARRHARDLTPAIGELLATQGWVPRELAAVLVSRGPGSYTGLRVGVMAAKTLAYATGCVVLGVDTFAAIARQAPAAALQIEVIADAQQRRVYVQRFVRVAPGEPPRADSELAVEEFTVRLGAPREGTWVTGPGLRAAAGELPPGWLVAPDSDWEPRPERLLELGLERFRAGERDDVWALEPLYLRRSSAEEQWERRGK